MSPTRLAIQAPKSCGLLALSLVAALTLGGCMGDDVTASTGALDDYHTRHPILLTDAPTTLDVFPVGVGGLDATTIADVRAFAARYAQYGVSRIVIVAPAGGGPRIHAGVEAVRRTLASAGLSGRIGLGVYPVADRLLAAPIKLSFIGLKAEVPSPCGQWPTDLASGSSTIGWQNQTYWNYGCATQSMMAAQVADPRDFVRASASGPGDVQMSLRAINNVRQGADPGTDWKIQNSNIGQIGGQ
ncbi:MAG TPA: CpaD family pilus assembly protein [Roseiarcus sp.]|jgi:pilus assembly protein CpaD|nr:CpaD family pilus assembly protein [Roseiarcus sp.]